MPTENVQSSRRGFDIREISILPDCGASDRLPVEFRMRFPVDVGKFHLAVIQSTSVVGIAADDPGFIGDGEEVRTIESVNPNPDDRWSQTSGYVCDASHARLHPFPQRDHGHVSVSVVIVVQTGRQFLVCVPDGNYGHRLNWNWNRGIIYSYSLGPYWFSITKVVEYNITKWLILVGQVVGI